MSAAGNAPCPGSPPGPGLAGLGHRRCHPGPVGVTPRQHPGDKQDPPRGHGPAEPPLPPPCPGSWCHLVARGPGLTGDAPGAPGMLRAEQPQVTVNHCPCSPAMETVVGGKRKMN